MANERRAGVVSGGRRSPRPLRTLPPSLVLGCLWIVGDAMRAGGPSAEGVVLSLVAAYLLTVILMDIAERLPWRSERRAGAIFALAYTVMALNVAIELHFFSTTPWREIFGILFGNVVFLGPYSLVLARGAAPVRDMEPWRESVRRLAARHTPFSWTWRVLVACLAYTGIYFVVGAAAFNFTEPFYRDPALGMNLLVPPLVVILPLQAVRGLIYVAAFVPVMAGVGGSRRTVGTLLGAVLFVGGGLAPLLVNTAWPVELRFYHSVEALFLGFLTGWAMMWALYPTVDKPRSE